MAKLPSSAVGVDIGFHTMKAVHLQRKIGGKISIVGYSSRVVEDGCKSAEELAHHVKLLVQEAGGPGKARAASVSGADTLVRILEQPPIPVEMMRNALKLNSKMLLHQDCADLVLDCDLAVKGDKAKGKTESTGPAKNVRYVVGGLPRTRVEMLSRAFSSSRMSLDRLQLAPLSLLNAFEFAHGDVFSSKPFILLDIGHESSMVVGGIKGELVMVRTVDFGGKDLIAALTMDGAIDRDSAVLLAEQGDAGMTDLAGDALRLLSREVLSSVGFFEGQWDQAVDRLFVTGGAARAEMVLQILSDEVNLPCEVWDVMEKCDIGFTPTAEQHLKLDLRNLNVAFGAAAELLIAAH